MIVMSVTRKAASVVYAIGADTLVISNAEYDADSAKALDSVEEFADSHSVTAVSDRRWCGLEKPFDDWFVGVLSDWMDER